MVRLRPPSVPVGARWTRTPPSVFFIGLLLFILTCSNVPFATSSIKNSSSRNFISKHPSINMDPVSQRTFFRSGTDLATKTLRVAREADHGIDQIVARRESSSVEFRKLNRVRKHRSNNPKQRNREVPTFPSINVEHLNLVNTKTINRHERYGALKNVSTVQSGTTVSQPMGSDFENVNVTAQSSLLNRRQWVPRVMMDLYEAAQRPGHTSPYGANIVRSFSPLGSVSVMNQTLLGDSFGEEDNRGYEGREGATLIPSITPDTVSYSFPFQLGLPKGEHIRNLLLRLHTIVERKHSPAGLERRLRVLFTRHPTSANSADGYSTSRSPRPVEVARKDVYLHNHTWLTLNVRTLLRHLGPPEHVFNFTLVLQIERAFASVGDTGDLALDHTSGIDFQPLLLLYTSQPNLTRKERHQFLHFGSRLRRSIHENDWDWDGGEEGEEEEPEPPGRDPGRKGRRAGRRRRAKNMCKRRPLKVDFESIGWQDWVIAPLEYEAYQCSGKCFYPLASHLNPTKHAVIQTLMHSRSSERARRACCVPTLLGPISLLYLEDGVPTFKKEYDDMVALECGCR